MIQKRFMVWVGLFSAGYITANQGLPKGEEFLMFQIAAWLVGFGQAIYLMKLNNWLKNRRSNGVNKTIRFFDFELKLTKVRSGKKPASVVKLVKSDSDKSVTSCDFCQGEEEIRLSGQKIQCPKCKGKVATAN